MFFHSLTFVLFFGVLAVLYYLLPKAQRWMLLVGHIGKLIKVSGGIMNTHSKVADRRMELMAQAAQAAGSDDAICVKIMECVSTDEAYRLDDPEE